MAHTTIFETDATSHAVNDLILFTENTPELAAIRDDIYSKWASGKEEPASLYFNTLLRAAMDKYIWTIKDKESCQHIVNMTISEQIEFLDLYANGFEDWKQEHGIN